MLEIKEIHRITYATIGEVKWRRTELEEGKSGEDEFGSWGRIE